MTNVVCNCRREMTEELNADDRRKFIAQLAGNTKFFSGDWAGLRQLVIDKSLKYDVILMAETVYNTKYYDVLIELLLQVLQQPNGQIYLASKTYYFGVGGGTREFEKAMLERGKFNHEVRFFFLFPFLRW